MKNVKGGSYSKMECDINTDSFAIRCLYLTIETQAVQRIHTFTRFSFAMPKNQWSFGKRYLVDQQTVTLTSSSGMLYSTTDMDHSVLGVSDGVRALWLLAIGQWLVGWGSIPAN